MAVRQALVFVAALSLAAGRLYAPPAAKTAAPVKAHDAPAAKDAKAAAKPAKAAPKKNVTAAIHKKSVVNMTADQQIAHLAEGLQSIQKLEAVFTAKDSATNAGKADIEQFAQGAMTTELSNKDSAVWSTIQAMMGATSAVMGKMKGKNKAEQEKIMDNLEKTLNEKAQTLKTVTDKASVVQEQHSEEYLLGVLMQHTKDWSFERQLNATKTFADSCTAAKELLKHHNSSQPLAPQLAALMDTKKAHAGAKVAAEKAAAKLFIQLVDSLHVARA